MPFCESCGAKVKTGARFCEDCGAALINQSPASGREKPKSSGIVKTAVGHPDQGGLTPAPPKNAALAAIASLLCPGLGQIYNGSTVLGVVILVGTVSGLYLVGFPGFIFWAYGVFNAFETAGRMNSGQKTPIPHNPTHIVIFVIGAAIASLVLGYLMTASGRSLFG
jgi:TM2 domain-containing membrane protein YozV